jgi:YtkA-like
MRDSIAVFVLSVFAGCRGFVEVSPSSPPTEVLTPSLHRATDRKCSTQGERIASEERAPYALVATVDGYIWTASRDAGTELRRWRRDSNAVETLSLRAAQVGSLALSGRNVVFAERGADSADVGRVVALSLDGEGETIVGTGTPEEFVDELSVAVDEDAIYWLTHEPQRGMQTIWRAGLSGHQQERIATVAVEMDQTISRMVRDGDDLYWAIAGGWLYRASAGGGTPELIVDEVGGIGGWDVRAGTIVYADRDKGSLHLVSPGQSPAILLQDAGARSALAMNDTRIYYATGTEVRSLTREHLVREWIGNASSVGDIDVNASDVVWSETRIEDGAVSWRCAAPVPAEPPLCPPESVPVLDLCAVLTWKTGPKVSATNAYVLRFFEPTSGAAGPYVDPSPDLSVTLWMPAHGHGSTPPRIVRESEGVYAVSEVNLPMTGRWELRHALLDGGVVRERFTMDIELR